MKKENVIKIDIICDNNVIIYVSTRKNRLKIRKGKEYVFVDISNKDALKLMSLDSDLSF